MSFCFSLSDLHLFEGFFVGGNGPRNDIDSIFHGFSFYFEHARQEVLILFTDFVLDD